MKVAIGLAILVIALAGCRHHATITKKNRVVEADVASYRKEVPKLKEGEIRLMARATNQLALDLFRGVYSEHAGKNVVFSPLSIAQDMSLLHESSAGETRKLVAKLLKADSAPKDALASYHAAMLNDMDTDPYESLVMANAIWIDDTYPVDSNVAKKLNALFGCSVKALPQDRDKAKSEMDAWVKDKTRDLIPEIRTNLTSNTYVMFLNALYFEGKWKFEFDERRTELSSFTTPNGEKMVPTMHADDMKVQAVKTDKAIIAEFPLLGDRYIVNVFMPINGDSLDVALKQMTTKDYYPMGASDHETKVAFPKLKFSSFVDFRKPLAGLGGEALFSPPLNLGAIAPSQASHQNGFFIGSVFQQAVFQLDEKGVVAAAVSETMGMAKDASEPVPVILNRPFLFFVVHRRSQAIVLCGAVNDPSKN